MSEIIKVSYTIKVEKFLARSGVETRQEFQKNIYDFITNQLSKCNLGHKLEIEVTDPAYDELGKK